MATYHCRNHNRTFQRQAPGEEPWCIDCITEALSDSDAGASQETKDALSFESIAKLVADTERKQQNKEE